MISSAARPIDAQGQGAFDDEWDAIEDSSCFCWGCFCLNCMCGSPCPTTFGQGKVCCCEVGVASAQPCCGEKGCLFGVSKLCCCLFGAASRNLAIGCCDVFCCGKPYGEDQMVEDHSLQFMEGVHWCCYCCIAGCGIATNPSPCVYSDIKTLCLEAKATTKESCWDDSSGCCSLHMKTCCCIHQWQLPPSRTLGLGCCCVPCIVRERRNSARSPPLVYVPRQEEMR